MSFMLFVVRDLQPRDQLETMATTQSQLVI